MPITTYGGMLLILLIIALSIEYFVHTLKCELTGEK